MKKMPATKHSGDSTKDAIRRAAVELFAEKGFTASSTREICERAGITKPVLYYHFGNKEQLYGELVADAFNEYRRDIQRAAQRGRTAREALAEVVTACFKYACRRPNLYRIGFRMVFAPEKGSPAIDYVEVSQADERVLTEIIRTGIHQEEFKGDAKFIAGALIGMITTDVMGYLLLGEPRLGRARAQNLVKLLIEGCGKNPTDR